MPNDATAELENAIAAARREIQLAQWPEAAQLAALQLAELKARRAQLDR